MLTALVPILMALVGALVYALASNPKMAELGRLLFWAGAFAVALFFAGKGVTLGPG